MSKFIDISGQRFGRLIVIKENGTTKNGDIRWLCRCDCGNEKTITGSKLRSGHTQSCGCLQRETIRKIRTKHNMSSASLYSIWGNMKERCYRKTNNRYYRYGARGITVCDEWHDFANFSEWAFDNGYEEGLSIDRIDIDKNYEPGNCRWIPLSEQMQNRSNTHWVEYNNEKICMSEFSRRIGISLSMVYKRLKKGMSGDDIAREFDK